ncbi:MAG TPA: CopG family transcriptional regulator [Ilumatobacteraceae bacterium]|nr:CopG family transcriptional regulator [Ilumatobacteraceae bacterium]
MRRTQIYLTDEQRSQVAERARARGCAQSQIIRELLDRGLGIETESDDPVAAIRETAGLLADEADWEGWQRSVRGRSADQRLTALNL